MFVVATAIFFPKFSSSVKLLSKDATKLNPLLCIFRNGIYEFRTFPFFNKDMTTLYRVVN